MVAAVPRPAFLVGLLAHRDLLAVGHRLEPVGADPEGDEVVGGRPGPALAVGDVVEVDIRGRRGRAEVVRPPFVDRSPR